MHEDENTQQAAIDAVLEQIHRFSRRKLSAEEVYLFDVTLCDNEIDRDNERFSLDALSQLQKLFIGKTGIFDHDPKGEKQTARLYGTELVQDPERFTTAGEVYTALKGHAYMVRTDANRDLIREIDGGIKKEVSISCAALSQTCSICGRDRRKNPCAHQVGHSYGDKRCHIILSDVADAYEWSFVAIPAQREAGVTKQYGADDTEKQFQKLRRQLACRDRELSEMESHLREEIVRLRFLVDGVSEQDAVAAAVQRMSARELLDFQKVLRTKQKQLCQSQLGQTKEIGKNGAFLMR